MQQIAVGDHHALRIAGRTRGVLEKRDGVAVDGGHLPGIGVTERAIGGRDDDVRRRLRDQRREISAGQHQTGAAIGDHPGDPPRTAFIVRNRRGHRDDTGVEAAEKRPQERHRVDVEQHHRPRRLRLRGQPDRYRPGIAVQIAVPGDLLAQLTAVFVEVGVGPGIAVPDDLLPDVLHKTVVHGRIPSRWEVGSSHSHRRTAAATAPSGTAPRTRRVCPAPPWG
ncbi:hypothetical protein FMUAM8_21720 [Nocardia cyriacigeorgica]|nr:hypothetical protein FMUAM8_21720 [Nocardia cyriacigeorgica]